MMTTLLKDLPTPHLVLDRRKLQRNLDRMAARADAFGVRLRPHMKTAKSADVAALALAGREQAITVSTMKEARYFADHGYQDITLAVGQAPHRLTEAAKLAREGVRLTLITDMPEMAEQIAQTARDEAQFKAMIEVDVGEHRGGGRRRYGVRSGAAHSDR